MNKLFPSLNVVLGLGRLLILDTKFPLVRYDHWHLQFVTSGFCTRSFQLAIGCWGAFCGLWCLGTCDVDILWTLQGKSISLCCLRLWRIEVKTENDSLIVTFSVLKISDSWTRGRAVIYRLQKQPNVLFIWKVWFALILKSRVLQSFKGYHALKFVWFVFCNLNGLFHVPLRLSRDFLSSHNTSAKGLILGGRCTKAKEDQATPFLLDCFLKRAMQQWSELYIQRSFKPVVWKRLIDCCVVFFLIKVVLWL